MSLWNGLALRQCIKWPWPNYCSQLVTNGLPTYCIFRIAIGRSMQHYVHYTLRLVLSFIILETTPNFAIQHKVGVGSKLMNECSYVRMKFHSSIWSVWFTSCISSARHEVLLCFWYYVLKVTHSQRDLKKKRLPWWITDGPPYFGMLLDQ